jgi:ATP-dependent DNA helicase RecG
MTTDTIQRMLSLGEEQHVEFNSGIANVDAMGKTVCAFLNTTGGYLICGVREPLDVVGLALSDDDVANLARKLHEGISPKSLVSIQSQVLDGKIVLVIEVPAGKDIPYAYQGAIYLREGDSNQPADAATIRDMVMRREIEPERWERRFSFADFDDDVLSLIHI